VSPCARELPLERLTTGGRGNIVALAPPMNGSEKFNFTRRFPGAVRFAVVAGGLALLAGCGSGDGKQSSAQAQAFDNAPAPVKQLWDKALAAEKAKDYLAAQEALESVRKLDLTGPQKEAADTEYLAFQNRTYQAAEKGDAAAVKAMQEIQARNQR
jgi:hypothetical protein